MRGMALLFALAGGAPGATTDPRLDDLLANERAQFLPPRAPVDARCAPRDEGEIVVCAHPTDTSRYRVPSTRDEAPLSAGATNTGIPHVGQSLVTDLPDCSPGHGCISGGYAPPPIYYLDVTKLPMPAPGSDADKIAKGEMRGN